MSSPHPLIASICSPVDAGKLSGRYVETTVDANGKPQPVIRSLRLLALEDPSKELVIRGSITPKKTAPSPSVADVDDLCNLFKSKASVTPKKKKSSIMKVVAKAVGDTNPSNDGKPSGKAAVVKTTPKRNARRSLRFSVSGSRRSLGGVA